MVSGRSCKCIDLSSGEYCSKTFTHAPAPVQLEHSVATEEQHFGSSSYIRVDVSDHLEQMLLRSQNRRKDLLFEVPTLSSWQPMWRPPESSTGGMNATQESSTGGMNATAPVCRLSSTTASGLDILEVGAFSSTSALACAQVRA